MRCAPRSGALIAVFLTCSCLVLPGGCTGLELTSGSSFCEIDANGCATDGGGAYGNDERCTIQVTADGTLTATVAIRLQGGQPASLTTVAPASATQSTTLNKSTSVPRNRCITDNAGFGITFPEDCGYPSIEGFLANGTAVSLNATAAIGADKSSIVLTVPRAPIGFNATATSYGRASWPMTVFFDAAGDKLPVIPWFSNFSCTDPSAPPL